MLEFGEREISNQTSADQGVWPEMTLNSLEKVCFLQFCVSRMVGNNVVPRK